MRRLSIVLITVALAVGGGVVGMEWTANAQEFPIKGRPITFVVPWVAGGSSDTSVRLLQATMERELGTRIEVVNVPGAGGQVGYTQFARTKPDGYSVLLISQPNLAAIVGDPKRQATFTAKDFQLVSMLALDPGVIGVRSDGPYKTVKDLVDAAKANPGKIKITCGGLFGDTHFTALLFQKVTGTNVAIANFNDGVAPAITATLGGHADATAAPLPSFVSTVKAGRVRLLTVLKSEPSSFVPEIPTMEALGYKGAVYAGYNAFAVPAGTPKEIVKTLSAAIKKAMDAPEVLQRMNEGWQGFYYLAPEEAERVWAKAGADTLQLMNETQK